MAPRGGGGFGRGLGRGFGRGRGWAMAPAAYGVPAYGNAVPTPAVTMTPEQHIEMLKTQAENLQATLGDIQRHIEELQNKKK